MGLFGKKKKVADVPDAGEPAPKVPANHAVAEQAESAIQEKTVTGVGAAVPLVPAQTSDMVEEKSHDRSLYRALLSGLYDAVLILDEKGMIIGTNPRVTTLFGYPGDDLWHTPCDALIPSMKPAVLMKIREHAKSGRFSVVNAACTRQDGTVFHAEIAMSSIDLFNTGDLLLSVRNIEKRVQGQNRKARDLVMTDALATAVVSCRADGMILSVNPAFLRLSGIEHQPDAVHRFIGDFCESNEIGVHLLLKEKSVGAHWVGEMQFVRASAHKVHVIATTARFMYEDAEQLAITFTPIPRRAALVAAATSG